MEEDDYSQLYLVEDDDKKVCMAAQEDRNAQMGRAALSCLLSLRRGKLQPITLWKRKITPNYLVEEENYYQLPCGRGGLLPIIPCGRR